MSEPEFPPGLVERCAKALCAFEGIDPDSNAFPDFEPDDVPAWRRLNYGEFAIAVLRESGHAELVAALKEARPYVWSPAHFKDDKRAKETLKDIDGALRKAGAL